MSARRCITDLPERDHGTGTVADRGLAVIDAMLLDRHTDGAQVGHGLLLFASPARARQVRCGARGGGYADQGHDQRVDLSKPLLDD